MAQPIKILAPIRLRDFNPDFHDGLDKDETREKALRLCQRIGELQELLHADDRFVFRNAGNCYHGRTRLATPK